MENVYNVYLFHSIQIYQLHYLRLARNSHLLLNSYVGCHKAAAPARLCHFLVRAESNYFVIFKLIRQKI